MMEQQTLVFKVSSHCDKEHGGCVGVGYDPEADVVYMRDTKDGQPDNRELWLVFSVEGWAPCVAAGIAGRLDYAVLRRRRGRPLTIGEVALLFSSDGSILVWHDGQPGRRRLNFDESEWTAFIGVRGASKEDSYGVKGGEFSLPPHGTVRRQPSLVSAAT